MAAARRRRLRHATIATLTLAVLALLPSAGATPQSPGESSDDVEITLTSITPVVDDQGTATIQGRLTNTGSSTLDAHDVDLVPQKPSDKRSDITDWSEGDDPVDGVSADSVALGDIAPGDSTTFTLETDAETLAPDTTVGAAWVSVQTRETAVHTFIGVHTAKEYEPLEVVWGIPLLLPSNPRLFQEPSAGRATAWEEAVGEDSRLARFTEEIPDTDEAWLLDPTLVSIPPEPETGTEEDVSTAMTDEREVRSERASELRERMVGDRTVILPEGDADVAAGADSDAVGELVTPRIEGASTLADRFEARDDVMWPADGLVTKGRAENLSQLRPGSDTPTLITQSSALAPGGFTPTGAARSTGGNPLLVSDTRISSLAGELTGQGDVTLARQRLVAETAAVLAERPGTPRTLFVLPDRSTRPSPEAYSALRDTSEDIPWLAKGDTGQLLAESAEAPADQVPRTREELADSPSAKASRGPVLSPGRAARIEEDEESAATFAAVRADGASWRRSANTSLAQLTSTRWRATPYAFLGLHSALTKAVTLSRDDLEVSSGDVNFFADSGRLQITIVNKSEVELSNLAVDLESDNPSFRIDEGPDPVTVGPGGRQTVTVQATALAAGQAPVHVLVTTPGGTELTHPATLEVRMRPTGSAIYWVIGGAAAVLLAAGTWRSVRRPRKQTVTEDDA